MISVAVSAAVVGANNPAAREGDHQAERRARAIDRPERVVRSAGRDPSSVQVSPPSVVAEERLARRRRRSRCSRSDERDRVRGRRRPWWWLRPGSTSCPESVVRRICPFAEVAVTATPVVSEMKWISVAVAPPGTAVWSEKVWPPSAVRKTLPVGGEDVADRGRGERDRRDSRRAGSVGGGPRQPREGRAAVIRAPQDAAAGDDHRVGADGPHLGQVRRSPPSSGHSMSCRRRRSSGPSRRLRRRSRAGPRTRCRRALLPCGCGEPQNQPE